MSYVLEGEDARAFHEYMERPPSDSDSTPESREITKAALEISKSINFTQFDGEWRLNV